MEIKREDLEARIAELSKLRDERLADANALGGAVQDCTFWLSRLAAEEKQENVAPTTLRAVE